MFLTRLLLPYVCTILIYSTFSLDWLSVDNFIQNQMNQGAFNGAVIGIFSSNSTLYKKAYGTIMSKSDGFYAPPVTLQSKFDINVLSQVIGTGSVLMELYDMKKIELNQKVSKFLNGFQSLQKLQITIDNLLTHNSGYQANYNATFPKTPDALIKDIQKLKLQYSTKSKFEYSQLGYILLGQVIEKVKDLNLSESFKRILNEAGLISTGFYNSSHQSFQFVPGGYNNGICQGIPYNKYAHFLDYMAGNSGLFSTLADLITYMQLMLNKGKKAFSLRIFSEEVVNLFTTPVQEKKYKNTFARGWQTVPQSNPPCGKKFSKNSFGLADTSGSYVWADKQKNIGIVFLANGNFPCRKNSNPAQMQGKLSDQIMQVLGY